MAAAPGDLVLDAKLETEFLDGCIRHTKYTMGFSARERRIRVREVWDIGSNLGRGSFGSVRVETCRPSPPAYSREPRRRAVKVISKSIASQGRWDYLKELEAVVKFSHERVRMVSYAVSLASRPLTHDFSTHHTLSALTAGLKIPTTSSSPWNTSR
jgi:hypothetical protein